MTIPDSVCEAVAARAGRRRSASKRTVIPDSSAPEALVAITEALVLAALPRRLDEDMLAQLLRVELAALTEAFIAVRGAPPYRALTELRLRVARRTAEQNPTLPVAAIATECGFPAYSRFQHEFQALFGEQPEGEEGAQRAPGPAPSADR